MSGKATNELSDAVITCTHNLCFEQKYQNYHFISFKNLYILWTARAY